LESLEDRRMLATGLQLIGIQPNHQDLLKDGDIRNVAPRELTFQFNEGQSIDTTTLSAIQLMRSGGDGHFELSSARTDFNTNGRVVVEFQALQAGESGNQISLIFSKSDYGTPFPPRLTVQGKTIVVELNTFVNGRTTALQLVNAINNDAQASKLVRAVVASGAGSTEVSSPVITYSPLPLAAANTATKTINFNTGTNLEVTFTAVQAGAAGNGIAIEFTKINRGGAGDPLINVVDPRKIQVQLNTNSGNETTAGQLVSAWNANAQARALVVASKPVGDPTTKIATTTINYSPVVLTGANDVTVTPGYVGLGDSSRQVIFRFAETLPDDLYRIEIAGSGAQVLRNSLGQALGDTTDDATDNGQDFSREFELDLAPQIQGVVPQPVLRTSAGTLSQSASQIEVYFTDDDLDPITATNPAFYDLFFTRDTVTNTDDVAFHPIAVQYFADSDRAMLTFASPLHQLVGAAPGTFRLRIGTDEVSLPPPVTVNLTTTEVGSSFATARDLGALTGSSLVSSVIDPQVFNLDFPGSSDEPGHRAIAPEVETHLLAGADAQNGISTIFYNFRDDYGVDPSGTVLHNLITPAQKQRAREIFELYAQTLGVQFVETATQGLTIATGDLRAVDPTAATGPGGVAGIADPVAGLAVMDAAENWYDLFGPSDDAVKQSWFEIALHEIGHLLGLGHSYELPPGTVMGSESDLAFNNPTEPVYPGDDDIVHGQYLFRPEGRDIDLYKFQLTVAGKFTAETMAERQLDASLLDTTLRLYREKDGRRELIGRNDDYFSKDSYLELDLEPGTYYVGVSASGNDSYDPTIEDSGFGGHTEGKYDLRLSLRPSSTQAILDLDNASNTTAPALSRTTPIDGDGDGAPGGAFNFWFRVDATPIFVDKTAAAGGNGTLSAPYNRISTALAAARPGDVVRIVGNGGTDGNLATPLDAQPYQIGFDDSNRVLADGDTLEVPKGVTVMVDRGAVFKLRRARIGVGSSSVSVDRSEGAFQVLGVPRLVDLVGNVIRDSEGNVLPGSVYFTSLNDEKLGGDTTPNTQSTPQPGDWGGIAIWNDLDRDAGRADYEDRGIFLNCANGGDFRYGGGAVVINGVPQVVAPVQAIEARPTVTFNSITKSADAAIAASPDSFEETNFHAPKYQTTPFTSDYARIGLDVHGNRVVDNSINGLFVRVRTPAGSKLEKLTVAGRWNDTDIVHVLAENLEIEGSPGGPVQDLTSPNVDLVTLEPQVAGNNEVQQLTFAGTPSGTFTLTYGANLTSGPITYSATPGLLEASIQAALDVLLGAGTTSVVAPSNTVVTVTFTGALGNVNHPALTATNPTPTGSLAVSTVREGLGNEVQSLEFSGTDGATVTLSYNGVSGTNATILTYTSGTAPTAAQVQTHLNSIAALTGNVTVLGAASGPFLVVFRNTLANVDVVPLAQTQVTTSGTTATVTVRTLAEGSGGAVPAGVTNYKVTFVDAAGQESPASDPTSDVTVGYTGATPQQTQSVLLSNLPRVPTRPAPLPAYVGRRLYRLVKSEYVLVAELNGTDQTYLDTGTTSGPLLRGSVNYFTPRQHGRLVIDPGTIVKLNGAGIQTRFGSELIAEGTNGNPVVFTSLLDGRYGAGGTLITSQQGAAAAGDWTGIYVGHASTASLDRAVIAYAGGVSKVPGSFSGYNAVEIQQGEARITNSLFEFNANGTGGQSTANRAGLGSNAAGTVFVRGAQPILLNNTFARNAGPSINIDVNSLNSDLLADSGRITGPIDRFTDFADNRGPLIRLNRIGFNEVNAMQVRGGTLTTQGVWDDTDIVHVLQNQTVYVPDFHTYGGLRLQSTLNESLVIKLQGANAGFTATGRPLDITDRIGGSLQVVGQPNHPVVLTSLADCTVGAGFRPDGRPDSDTLNRGACGIVEMPSAKAPYIDLIVVMDESGSMLDAQQFTTQLVADIDQTLVAGGVGDGTRGVNQFALVGYGNSLDRVSEVGRSIPVGPNGELWGTAADYQVAANNLVDVGGTEDGYAAIDFAMSNYTYRSDAAKFVLLVTNEDRDILDRMQTYGTTVNSIRASGAILHSLLAVDVTAVGGVSALAADANNNAYLEAPNGAFTVAPLQRISNKFLSFFDPNTSVQDYANLTFDLGGVVGDFDQISVGGNTTTSFSNVFTSTIQAQAGAILTPGAPGDWRSVRLDQNSSDRNFDVAVESESGNASADDLNAVPDHAQYLGALAPNEESGDDNLRLGFEVHGSLNRPGDVDVYSFDATAGTEVWLDIDRTTFALDTVVELVDVNGSVLARSNDSETESVHPDLLYRDSLVLQATEVNPLDKSPFLSQDLYTTNPRDAGMRVTLPGPQGSLNTYHVRIRSNGPKVASILPADLAAGLTAGVYQLQVRLQETDEFPGSTVRLADIRFATNGIEVIGLPAHSPLTGEATEPVAAAGNDTNNSLGTADNLGNLLNTDRGTLGVAGTLDTAADVDWYRFDVWYDSTQQSQSYEPANTTLDRRYFATTFDIDYADGFARPNTNLWIYDSAGRLVLVGRDSNVAEDRPAGGTAGTTDAARGSMGELDPFVGPVELPAAGFSATTGAVAGFTPGTYYVAVSSNARLPAELQQFYSVLPPNTRVRLEPIDSVRRIAEDHVADPGYDSTAEAPQVPILFGEDDEVTLIVPAGNVLNDGETFTITNAAGNSQTYEFDVNGSTAAGHVPVRYQLTDSAATVWQAVALAINTDPPPSPNQLTQPALTPQAPTSVSSNLYAYASTVGVALREYASRQTLLYQVTTNDPFTNQIQTTPRIDTTWLTVTPQVRQAPAPGQATAVMSVSRPAAVPYSLSDVTLFMTVPGTAANRSTLVSVDAFSGRQETTVGAFGANVEDVAQHPNGSLYAYSIPNAGAHNDANTGHLFRVDPSLTTPAALGTDLGDDGIETYVQDPMNPLAGVRPGNNMEGVGIDFNAIALAPAAVDSRSVRGFAIGNRGDVYVDPTTGQVYFGPQGIPNPANVIFEFNPNTGAAVNPPNTPDRKDAQVLYGAGTQIWDRGSLDTTVDAFPVGGADTTVTGVSATAVDPFLGTVDNNIEDQDFFQIDHTGDGIGDVTFEFDTGPEFFFAVGGGLVTNPQVLRDGDTFTVDNVSFEFDTGTVLLVTAVNGNQLRDGGTITISDNAANPVTVTFEFDNNGNAGANTPIPYNANSNQQAIITGIVNAINSTPNFAVRAVQLPNTNRISLTNESLLAPVAVNAQGVITQGTPGVIAPNIAIPVEETDTELQIGQSIMTVIDGSQPGGFQAGAAGGRLNFMGAQTANFNGISSPLIFQNVNPYTGFTTGVAGTSAFSFAVPFLVSDDATMIATRVTQAIQAASVAATRTGATILLDAAMPQPIFVTSSFGTPPQIGAPGIPDCPLQSGGVAPGGTITGMAFLNDEMFVVTDTGGLFRVASSWGDAFYSYGTTYFGGYSYNVADYIDGSRELLAEANVVTTYTYDPLTGQFTATESPEPIRFTGLTAGPQNTADGRYANLLFGVDQNGRMFAFDTFGHPQPVFADGATSVEVTSQYGSTLSPNGLAFSTLDDSLWHVSYNRRADAGHGVDYAYDESRLLENRAGNTSFYFGYEGWQGATGQPQFGTNAHAPGTPTNTYDFPGGAHGELVSNAFSLAGYSEGDRPTLYFNYFLDTEQPEDQNNPTGAPTTILSAANRVNMRDAFRVYVSGDDGVWKLLETNNASRGPLYSDDDELDPFFVADPVTSAQEPEQPFTRQVGFDTREWRQARIDLTPYVGQSNLRLRFLFSTAGGLSTGGMNTSLDLDVAGNELRAVAGTEVHDGDLVTLTDWNTWDQVAFEFDLGPTIVAPGGAGVNDGDTFNIDGTVYEFDSDGVTGATNNIPHFPVSFVASETPAQMAADIEAALAANPPKPVELLGQLTAAEPNDTLVNATDTGLDGSTQTYRATGSIGDNLTLTDRTLDVDLVRMHLAAGDRVTITTNTSRMATQLDTYLRLFDAEGQPLTANDNVDPSNPFSRDSKIEFTAPQRGDYYVGVSGAHDTTYVPTVAGSGGGSGKTPSTGLYELSIAVTNPVGPQRVGNRLNLPNADVITAQGLPAGFVEGAAGVRASLPNTGGTGTGQATPVYPVLVHLAMDSQCLADALQMALADHLAGGVLDAFRLTNDVVDVPGYWVDDPGPLGLSGPSDPNTDWPNSGLFGDLFGAFNASAGPNGQVQAGLPGAQRMQNNRFEGVYVDDLVIGFAGRGEMVTNSQASQTPQFAANPDQPDNEIDQGAYQLEIRPSTSYGIVNQPPFPPFLLTRSFDASDRLAQGTTLVAAAGALFADGQTFSISDGANTVVFEFNDAPLGNGVAAGHVAIDFESQDSAVLMARRIRDAINLPAVQQTLAVVAASGDGITSGATSTSDRVNLFGNATVTIGSFSTGAAGTAPVAEANDILAAAINTGLRPGGWEGYRGAGVIGDNAGLAEFGADVDLFRVDLKAGEALTVNINAESLAGVGNGASAVQGDLAPVPGRALDSLLRVFDQNGVPLMQTDPFGRVLAVTNDDGAAPGETLLKDSYLAFTAPQDGAYYIGVSGFNNTEYDPTVAGSGRAGTTGYYQIEIQRPLGSAGLQVIEFDDRGDRNTPRDQGQVILSGNRITNAAQFGISVTAGTRSALEGNAPHPGPARNLQELNTSRLVPGVTITNNLLVKNGSGGIDVQGDSAAQQAGVVPFGRIVNNTIVGFAADVSQSVSLIPVKLTGLTGTAPDAGTAVYRANLSSIPAPTITSLTFRDDSFRLGGAPGMFTGFDLDAVKISTVLVTDAAQVDALPGINVFDFTASGTTLVAGAQRAPIDPALFGTSNGLVDNTIATLGQFDGRSSTLNPSGFVSLGDGGTITFTFASPLAIAPPLYFYFGEVGDNGEVAASTLTATTPGVAQGTGIRVRNSASPTILNNILSGLAVGIAADASSASTVVGGSLYHRNATDATGVGPGSFAIVANQALPLFVNATLGDYYPARGSVAVDSAVNSLDDRPDLVRVRTPLAISPSPVLAPGYDASGQLRVDDPLATPPPGLGSNVFKDRGALERADFEGPTAQLIYPQDNGAEDLDPGVSLVNLARTSLDNFTIKLTDTRLPLYGSGINRATVSSDIVKVIQDNRTLEEGVDYNFNYSTTDDLIRLTPLAGVWDPNSNYIIQLANYERFFLYAVTGANLKDGDNFQLTDQYNNSATFEYDCGYVLQVPRTLAVQIPLLGGAAGGVADGDTLAVTKTTTVGGRVTTTTVTLELDNNGVYDKTNNIQVPFTATSSQGEIADALVAAWKIAGLGLSPVNAGSGLVHLGVDGTQDLTVTSQTIQKLGGTTALQDGQKFTVDDGARLVTFELDNNQRTETTTIRVPFTFASTYTQIADTIARTIASSNLGLVPVHLGQGRIHVGGTSHHKLDVTGSSLILTNTPGAQPGFGFQLPTTGALLAFGTAPAPNTPPPTTPATTLYDGQTFTISRGTQVTVSFEFDSDGTTTPGNLAIPFTRELSPDQLADRMVGRIRSTDLQLFPYNAGYGQVVLGGDATYAFNPLLSCLKQLGQPGVPAAESIFFIPDKTFTAAQVAQGTVDAISHSVLIGALVGVQARVAGDQVMVTGLADASGTAVKHVRPISDLSANVLQANQVDGGMRFTVVLGAGLDYGDAPAPYPTLRSDDGARHEIVKGFSLGPTVNVNADGQPSSDANVDSDEDGVAFDARTALTPGRPFNFTVSISGLGTVQQFGVLDVWFDYNRDGVWSQAADEHIVVSQIITPAALTNGGLTFTKTVPAGASVGQTYARFRLSTASGLRSTGAATAGEVEDYAVTIDANPWQNATNIYDVNNSGTPSPVDVLLIVNELNARASASPPIGSALTLPKAPGTPFFDVNGDGLITPVDALLTINYLNDLNNPAAEGEAAAPAAAWAGSPAAVVVTPNAEARPSNSPMALTSAVNQVGDRAAAFEPAVTSIADAVATKRRPASPAVAHVNHLDDVLSLDDDWLPMVSDVDRALQTSDARDAVFARLGA
jgi:hypothetical protein